MTTTELPLTAAHLTIDHVGQFVDNGEPFTIGHQSVLNGEGDTRRMWDSRNADEVALARKDFEAHLSKGFLAYKAEGKKGTQGEQIRTFDPRAERIIFVKPTQGG